MPGLGPGGRRFESFHPDVVRVAEFCCSFFFCQGFPGWKDSNRGLREPLVSSFILLRKSAPFHSAWRPTRPLSLGVSLAPIRLYHCYNCVPFLGMKGFEKPIYSFWLEGFCQQLQSPHRYGKRRSIGDYAKSFCEHWDLLNVLFQMKNVPCNRQKRRGTLSIVSCYWHSV